MSVCRGSRVLSTPPSICFAVEASGRFTLRLLSYLLKSLAQGMLPTAIRFEFPRLDTVVAKPDRGDFNPSTGLVADGRLGRLMQGMALPAAPTRKGGILEMPTVWDKMFSGTILPGAQFVAVGILKKPLDYYKVSPCTQLEGPVWARRCVLSFGSFRQ